MADKRYRIRQCFWLDIKKDDQLHMFEEIEALKRKRKWTRFILDAIGLMLSLMTGSDDRLRALFGDIWERIYQQGAHDARSQLQLEHDARIDELERLITILKTLPTAPVTSPLSALDSVDAPLFVEAGEDKVSASEARENFSAGMGNLFDDDDDDLWDDDDEDAAEVDLEPRRPGRGAARVGG